MSKSRGLNRSINSTGSSTGKFKPYLVSAPTPSVAPVTVKVKANYGKK